MGLARFQSLKKSPTFAAAISGGIPGIVLQIDHVIATGSSTSYSLGVVFIASLLAGFLAYRNKGKSRSAGIAAAALALLPAVLSISTPISYFIDTYGAPGIGMATATVILFVAFVALVAAITGSLGGRIGGWIGNNSRV